MPSISQYNSRIYKVLKLLICLNLRMEEYDVAPQKWDTSYPESLSNS